MKYIYSTILLVVLMLASAATGYEAANSWNNIVLANWCLFFFSIFWGAAIVLSIRVVPKDKVSDEIEDRNYNSNNVNSK